jgi:uncharacterized membrane protein
MNYVFLSGILLVMLIFSIGLKMYRNPSDIDGILAYRSDFSKKNEDTWYSANLYAGFYLMILATTLLFLLFLLEILLKSQIKIFSLIMGYFLSGGVLTYFLTERRLKKVFFRDGKRRPGSF